MCVVHPFVCQGSFIFFLFSTKKKLQEIAKNSNCEKKPKLYLWLCIVCILLASLPLALFPSLPTIVCPCLCLCGCPCVCLSVCLSLSLSVFSAFRLPRVLSHCLCVQLPSAVRRMLTLTLPNALQPLPPSEAEGPYHLPGATQMSSQKRKNVPPRCILLRGIPNIPHVAASFFLSVSLGLDGFFVGFLLLLDARKNKNIFGMCGKYVKRWKRPEGASERNQERDGSAKVWWAMQKIRIYRQGARKLDMDMDNVCRSWDAQSRCR